MTLRYNKALFNLLHDKIPEIQSLPANDFYDFELGNDAIVTSEEFGKTDFLNIDKSIYTDDLCVYYCKKYGAPKNFLENAKLVFTTCMLDILQPIVMPLFNLPKEGDIMASIYDKKTEQVYAFLFNMKSQTARFCYKAQTDIQYLFKYNLSRKVVGHSQDDFTNYLRGLNI